MTTKIKSMFSRITAQCLKPVFVILAVLAVGGAWATTYSTSQDFTETVTETGWTDVTGGTEATPVVFSATDETKGLTVSSGNLGLSSGYWQISSGTYNITDSLFGTEGVMNFAGNYLNVSKYFQIGGATVNVTGGTIYTGRGTADDANPRCGAITVAQWDDKNAALNISGGNVYSYGAGTNSDGIDYWMGLVIASGANSVGEVTVSDWGRYDNANDTKIASGSSSQGTLTVKDNGYFWNWTMEVAPTGQGFVNAANNATLHVNGRITAGMGGTGTVNVSDSATFEVANFFVLGQAGTGNLNVTGGTVTIGNDLQLATGEGATATATISGGSVSSTWDTLVGRGAKSTASLTVSGTANVDVGRTLVLAWDTGSTGTLNLNGGTFKCNYIDAGAGTATINFNGGTLVKDVNGDTYSPRTEVVAGEGKFIAQGSAIVVGANGGTIDTNGRDITIASAVTGPGKLTLTGGGTVRFSSSCTCKIILDGTTTAYDSSNNEIKTAFTWKGATGANWSDGSNWWGGSAPGASDKAVFDGNASVNINANATVGGIVINNNAEVTLAKTGNSILYVRGNIEDSTATKNSGKLILSGVTIAAQAATLINAKLSFAENTTSTIQTDGNYGGFNVEIYGDVDGAGTVNWFTGGSSNSNRREHGILFYCSFANFSGESYVKINNYLHYLKMVSDSCLNCKQSKWHFYEDGELPRYDESCRGGYQFYSGVSNGSALKFGKLCGSIFGRYNTLSYHDPLNVVFEVGYLPGEDSDISGEINGTGLNQTLDWVSESATLKYSISNFQRLVVSGGGNAEFRDASKLPVAICFINNAGFVRFADGVTGSDILAKFKSSTAAIGFDDMNVSYNWSGEIDNSNEGGFTKKGGGTLTLSTAPKYTGATTILEGGLTITESKTFSDPVAVFGGTFTPAGGSVFNGAVTVSGGTFDASAGATFGGDVEMTGGAIKIACGASIPSLALTEAGALNVDLASATLADGTALFTVASVASGATINYLNQPEGFDSSKIQVVEQGGKTVYVYGVRTLTWNGASTTDATVWSDSANWGDAGVPSAVDNISLPANPGFVLTEDVAVNDLTAASGLTLNLAYDLTVNGDLNVTGALVKNGVGNLVVKGTLQATKVTVVCGNLISSDFDVSDVQLPTDSAYDNTLVQQKNCQGRIETTGSLTLASISGSGQISATEGLTFNLSADKTFIGSMAGGNVVKQGVGTLTIIGTNTFSGSLSINEGCVRLSNPVTGIGSLRHDFDAQNSKFGWVTSEEDGTVDKWYDTVNKDAYLSTVDTVTFQRPKLEQDATNPFGGKKVLKSDAFRMVNSVGLQTYYNQKYSTFLVCASTTAFGKYTELVGNNNDSRWCIRMHNTTSGSYDRCNSNWSGAHNAWCNGNYGIPLQSEESVYSIVGMNGILRVNRAGDKCPEYYGGGVSDGNGGGNNVWGEILVYGKELTCEEKTAVEAYLMAKWGVGNVKYTPIPEAVALSMSANATLDLNGLSQKVASLTAATGSTLKMTSDATLTVTGTASVDGMTLQLTDTPAPGKTYVLLTASDIIGDVTLNVAGYWKLSVVDNADETKSLVIAPPSGFLLMAF